MLPVIAYFQRFSAFVSAVSALKCAENSDFLAMEIISREDSGSKRKTKQNHILWREPFGKRSAESSKLRDFFFQRFSAPFLSRFRSIQATSRETNQQWQTSTWGLTL